MALKSPFNRRPSSSSPTSSSSTGFPKPDKQTSWDQNDPPRVGAYQFPTSPANSPSAGDVGVVSIVVTEPSDPPRVSPGTYGAQLHPLPQLQQRYLPKSDGLASERSRRYQPYRPARPEAFSYHPSALDRGEDTSASVAGQRTKRFPLHHRSPSGHPGKDMLAEEAGEVMPPVVPQIPRPPTEPVLTHPQIDIGSSQGINSHKSESSKHSRPASASRRASPAPDPSSDAPDGDAEITDNDQLDHILETPRRHKDTHSQTFTVEVIEDNAQASNLLYVMPPVNVPALQVATPAKERFDTGLMMLPTSSNSAVDADNEEAGSTNTVELSGTGDSDSDQNGNVHQTKPTCSLNLVCYRSGASGCKLHQLHVAKQSRFKDEKAFLSTCKARPGLITTDEQFFRALKHGYQREMCGFFRRHR